MTRILIIAIALATTGVVIHSWLTLNRTVESLLATNKTLSAQLENTREQHNAETAISLLGLSASQRESSQQEKNRIEIRKEIIKDPCSSQPVPAGSAQRLWQLTTQARNATLSDTPRDADGLTSATIAGK